MNKKRMGQLLKQLRTKKKLSLEALSEEFQKEYITVSVNAISSWENGKTIPDIDNLNFLASFYGISVDDILFGKINENIDFNSIYFIHRQDAYLGISLAERQKIDIYGEISNEGSKIRKRFKYLVRQYISENCSRNEKEELKFLLENYFKLDSEISIHDFLHLIKKLKQNNYSKEELWWEVQKYISPIDLLTLTFSNISDEKFTLDSVKKRIDYLEDWEKDQLLATIQRIDPIFYDPTDSTSKGIEQYEEEFGKEFNREQIVKDTIRFLINNGACLNNEYLGYVHGDVETFRIIDTLEEAHNFLNKPFRISVIEDEKQKSYFVENNQINRLMKDYRYTIVNPLLSFGYNIDEIFTMVIDNKELPDEVYLKAAETFGIDLNRENKYVKADAKNKMWSLIHFIEEYRNKVLNYENYCLDSREELEKSLFEGINEHWSIIRKWIGGIEPSEVMEYSISKNKLMSFSEYKQNRLVKETQNLLKDLDRMDLQSIRSKYFTRREKQHA